MYMSMTEHCVHVWDCVCTLCYTGLSLNSVYSYGTVYVHHTPMGFSQNSMYRDGIFFCTLFTGLSQNIVYSYGTVSVHYVQVYD